MAMLIADNYAEIWLILENCSDCNCWVLWWTICHAEMKGSFYLPCGDVCINDPHQNKASAMYTKYSS